jgi:hypothetical protein
MPAFLRIGWPEAVKKELKLTSSNSIEGNSTDRGHQGWFDVLSLSLGGARAMTPLGSAGGQSDRSQGQFGR